MAAPPTIDHGLHTFEAGETDVGLRVDVFLAAAIARLGAHLSRTRLKGLVADGFVRIDGQASLDPNRRVQLGQRFELDVPEPAPGRPEGEHIPLHIVFEDSDLLVLDKPGGTVVHPGAGHETGTLVNALIAHCGETLSGIGGVKRPGIVHRLDKNTSGLLVVAKNDAAHRGLSRIFADHGRTGSLVRVYKAFVWGEPGRHEGKIDAPIGRHPHQREKMAIVASGKGREAVTHWRLLETFGGVVTLVACQLETGRTHQIRVHMSHIGHPLLGDAVYGGGFKTKASLLPAAAREALELLARQALHAAVLGFEHPVGGQRLLFDSPLPSDLQQLADALRVA